MTEPNKGSSVQKSALSKKTVISPVLRENTLFKERRKYMRFKTPLDMEYKTLTLNPIFGKALAKDLSREGVRLGLKHNLTVGTSLELRWNVPGDNLPVFATGKIAWADGLEAGIKLTKISRIKRPFPSKKYLVNKKHLQAAKK